MSSHTPPTVHVRVPKSLKDELQAAAARDGRSLNESLVQRFKDSLGKDDAATRLADILRPLLNSLSEEDQAAIITAARILAKDRRKKPAAKKA